MTTAQHKEAILARIGDCAWHIAQAAAAGRVVRGECPTWRENAIERAAELFLAGYYAESRRVAEEAR
jgi:hypothetical protein